MRALLAGLLAAVACTAHAPASNLPLVTLADAEPRRSSEKSPWAAALVETWLAGYAWPQGRRFDQERYEIVRHEVSPAPAGRALLQFRCSPHARG